MGLLKKLFGKNKDRHDAFHRNLASLLAAQNIDLILDVGANQGQFAASMFFYGYNGRIVSFEPGAIAHATLSAVAKGKDSWTIAPRMALGRTRETLTLHAYNRTDMNSLFRPTLDVFKSFPKLTEAASEPVSVERLDNVLNDYAAGATRILLKIDTQGSELAVIEGASGCLDRVTMLQLEIPVTAVYEGSPTWMDILGPVHQNGFRPVLTASGYFSKKINRQIDMDAVFLRQPAV